MLLCIRASNNTEESLYNQPFSDAALNGDFHNLTQEFMQISRAEGSRAQVRVLDETDDASALLDGNSQSGRKKGRVIFTQNLELILPEITKGNRQRCAVE